MLNDFLPADVPALPDAADAVPTETGVTIVVCRACRYPSERDAASDAAPRPGALLAANVRGLAAGTGISVREASCLANCRRSLSAAILRTGSWSYVFGDLTTDSGADLLAGARLFSASRDSLMPFSQRPESLKRGLVARVPSFGNLEELP